MPADGLFTSESRRSFRRKKSPPPETGRFSLSDAATDHAAERAFYERISLGYRTPYEFRAEWEAAHAGDRHQGASPPAPGVGDAAQSKAPRMAAERLPRHGGTAAQSGALPPVPRSLSLYGQNIMMEEVQKIGRRPARRPPRLHADRVRPAIRSEARVPRSQVRDRMDPGPHGMPRRIP